MDFSLLTALIDFLFAASAATVGLIGGQWLRRTKPQSTAEADRAVAAVKRLQDLATSVAANVGEHSSRVREISSDITNKSNTEDGWNETVVESVADIIKANERLQEQLATAEVQLQRQAAELETQVAVARTDALTGLPNRRAFDDEMNRRHAEWQRRKTPFSLVMIDVDHFKKFNDQHGHQAGDQVLRDVAKALAESMRDMDLVTRYGGEEFAIVMPVTMSADAAIAAERARTAVAKSISRFQDQELRVTASLGLAQVEPGDTTDQLVRRADEALYAAKKAGRNCTWFHNLRECLPVHLVPQVKPAAGATSTVAEPRTIAAAPAPTSTPAPIASQMPAAKPVTAVPDKPAVAAAFVAPVAPTAPAVAPAAAQPPVKRAPLGTRTGPAPEQRSLTAFCTDLRRQVMECREQDLPLSLVLMDVDELKTVSERLGTAAREKVLETINEFLDATRQPADVISRYGDGRFALMMPGTDLAGAVQQTERTRAAIAANNMQLGGHHVRLTTSLGMAQAGPQDDPSALIKRADAALFASKAAGGNCAHSHNGRTYELVTPATV